MNVGAVIPPQELYLARAPIHPKRPYGLTRPVVPPDGSFILGGRSAALPNFERERAPDNYGLGMCGAGAARQAKIFPQNNFVTVQ